MTQHVDPNSLLAFDPSAHPKWPRQVELEMEMMEQGVSRFRSMCKRAKAKETESQLPHVRRLLNQFIEPVVTEIEYFLASQKRKRGVRHTSSVYLPQVEPEVAAFLALKVVMDRISYGSVFAQRAAFSIGRAIMAEVRLKRWSEQHPDIWEAYQKRFDRDGSTTEHRKKVLRHGFNKLIRDKIEWTDWPEQDLLHLGMKMLELLIRGTKRFEMREVRTSPTASSLQVFPTGETAEWLIKAMRHQELLFPVYLPTVMPPKPWSSPTSGGYWTGVLRDFNLVRYSGMTKGMIRQAEAVLRSADMDMVYRSVNLLQNTGWSVNRRVLEVASHLWTMGNAIGPLPPRGDVRMPEKPHDIDTNEQARREWRARAKEAHTTNTALTMKRLTTETILGLATQFAEEGEFYFPHHLDFRGRAYPVVSHFSPQGGDLTKGLLQFAEGLPIETQEAEEWLAIHVANTWGVDKVSYGERIAWVRENERDILRWAKAPLADLGWAKADGGESAFQFLAAAMEWAEYRKHGQGYISRLPIRIDGTCNGLQHLSALLRDQEGGKATNLVPSETPSDIYKDVAKIVTRRLQQIAHPSATDRRAELARQWLRVVGGEVPRSLTKRSVMILPYGGTMMACRQYIGEWVEATAEAKVAFPRDQLRDTGEFTKDGKPKLISPLNEALTLMTELVWKAIPEVVVAADVAFRWIKGVAKMAAEGGQPLVWTTPAGFPVFHFYAHHPFKKVEVRQEAAVLRMNVPSPSNKMEISDQLSGVAPNFVHSLDGANMMLCLCTLGKEGVGAVTTIHDSFGTHAGNMGLLSQCLRASFVAMYEQTDPMEDFREYCQSLCPDHTLPAVPSRGTLELGDILHSPYFFA